MLKYLRLSNKRTKAIWWALIVITVVTFVGGFIFILGSGLDSTSRAQAAGALGVVNGEPITRIEFQNALEEQREGFKRQYGSDPADQDARTIEAQAWRGLVAQRLLDIEAKKLGLKASDREVLLLLQTSPPQVLMTAPDFQTNGQFDPQKYAAALRNPGNNWSAFEAMARAQLPTRKLQERLLASVKLSQAELEEAFRNQYERLSTTVVQVPPAVEAQVTPPTEADLNRVYEKYKSRFSGPARMQLEVLEAPKKYGEEELRVAREQAKSLVERARRGEDFAALARDYSEGAGADRGGMINRLFQPSEFGPEHGPKLAALPPGAISDPIQEGGRFTIFKVIDRMQDPMSPVPNLRVAQILIKARPGDETLREQFAEMRRLRTRATRGGLGKAAAAAGLVTSNTGWFDANSAPPHLAGAPEALDWAVSAKSGEVSPVFDELEGFMILQKVEERPAGPPPKADVMEQLRQIAEVEARTAAAKPKADLVAQALARGSSLEQSASAAGLSPFKVEGMTRQQPDPRLGDAPEVVGRLFGTPVGRTIGPIQTTSGWVFARVDQKTEPDTAMWNDTRVKGQVTTQILNRKQQEFFTSWLTDLRRRAKVRDLRLQQ
jgi:parvulin-like peptidyl-prolyl isomerase